MVLVIGLYGRVGRRCNGSKFNQRSIRNAEGVAQIFPGNAQNSKPRGGYYKFVSLSSLSLQGGPLTCLRSRGRLQRCHIATDSSNYTQRRTKTSQVPQSYSDCEKLLAHLLQACQVSHFNNRCTIKSPIEDTPNSSSKNQIISRTYNFWKSPHF